MVATVRLYYNTGLTVSNCLDSVSLLDTLGFKSKDFPNIAIKQDRGLIDIRINAVYDDVKDADYCKINDNCYWVTGIVMLNDNVAQITLQQDCVTTVGVTDLLEIVSGWCTRRHVDNDELFRNIIDEPFVPTNEPVIDTGTVIGDGEDGFFGVVLSSIDLLNITDTAKAYIDDARDKVLVPNLPFVSDGENTVYTSHIVSGVNNIVAKPASIAMSNAFNPQNSMVAAGMQNVRSLGIESCICAAYTLPKSWATMVESNGLITQLNDKVMYEKSALKSAWGEYKNNKVYSGQFQKIVVFSIASGESCENRVEDIIDPESKEVTWVTYADTRYSGKPGCKPLWFKGHSNNVALQAVYGSNWQQTPITYSSASGNLFTVSGNNIAYVRNLLDIANSTLRNVADLAPSIALAAANPMSAFGGGMGSKTFYSAAEYTAWQSSARQATAESVLPMVGPALNIAQNIGSFQLNRQQIMLTNNSQSLKYDLYFSQVPQMADYVQNAFYDLRYRLSDNDMERFDKFLTCYGYAVDEDLRMPAFRCRKFFNFVKARDVVLKLNGCPQYLLDGMARQIEAGVWIWHTSPGPTALLDNPIV